MPLVSGKTYVFYNHQGGTALDLDTGSKNVQGWAYHEGSNQQWKATSHSDEAFQYWTFQNVQTGTYLAFQPPAQDGKRVICIPQPVADAKWRLWQDSGGAEVYIINPLFHPKLCVDLADGGKSVDGTPVQLWTFSNGDNQRWEAKGV